MEENNKYVNITRKTKTSEKKDVYMTENDSCRSYDYPMHFVQSCL